ncbi:MAG TPA: cytochrome C oxidase subunit IV family protein [Polyangiaceae bacterium]|jgi:cytochrome c oxidase subunit 4|nr:cytochrome C oxidase subunit IV family protein [Polyangiaceae bacterium]
MNAASNPSSALGRTLRTGALLLVLAGLSYGLSFVEFGRLSLVIALAIAALKALLVLFVFMQFGTLPASARLGALSALFMLLLLASLMAADIASRSSVRVAEPAPGNANEIQAISQP